MVKSIDFNLIVPVQFPVVQLFQEISNFLDHQRFPKILAKNWNQKLLFYYFKQRGSVASYSDSRRARSARYSLSNVFRFRCWFSRHSVELRLILLDFDKYWSKITNSFFVFLFHFRILKSVLINLIALNIISLYIAKFNIGKYQKNWVRNNGISFYFIVLPTLFRSEILTVSMIFEKQIEKSRDRCSLNIWLKI